MNKIKMPNGLKINQYVKKELRLKGNERGFSMIELIMSLILTLIILGIGVTSFVGALNSRSREASKTDAITSTQAALNIMSREIGNSGYGLTTNGIITADSTDKKLHFRTNTGNNDGLTSAPGEDVTFYYDAGSKSVVRYDAYDGSTSGVINRVSDVDFIYWNYADDGTSTAGSASLNTGRINIKLKVILGEVSGQPIQQEVVVQSDVTLRNSTFMLGQY
jgi:type II secretory pathway pseudopilin PulG